MEVFLVKSLTSVLSITLMASSVVPDKMLTENINGNNGRTPGTKNNTKDQCNQDGTGTRRSVALSPFIVQCTRTYKFTPDRPCYTQFFVKGIAPRGLRDILDENIRYICQPPTSEIQPQDQTYYATMFDERYGIAVFSAYKLSTGNVDFQKRSYGDWCETPGIKRQGSTIIYSNQKHKLLRPDNKITSKYDRGHLVPAATLSSSVEGYLSTYTYTNAVPQHHYFNTGQWNVFEERIRKYASTICIKYPGTLYLLTGTSFTKRVPDNTLSVETLLVYTKDDSDISIPNLLWTAGCCVLENGDAESFAVIGENKIDPNVKQIVLNDLQEILRADVTAQGRYIGGPAVELFPGYQKCLARNINI